MDLEIEVHYFSLKLSDGFIHFFKRTVVKPKIDVSEIKVEPVTTDEDAERMLERLRSGELNV